MNNILRDKSTIIVNKQSHLENGEIGVFDTTSAIGRLFITIVGAMAQWERENLGERVKMGMEQKCREGKLSKKSTLGYTSLNGHTFSINESEAEIIKLIFNKYVNENKGMDMIARELNQSQYKKMKAWIGSSISYILKNEIYMGNLIFNKRQKGKIKTDFIRIKNIYPQIISADVFNKAQLLLKQRNVIGASAATKTYIFSTLIRCAKCGNKLTANYSQHGIKKFSRYQCKNFKIHLWEARSISEHVLTDLVVNYLQDYLTAQINEINAIKIDTESNEIDITVYTNKLDNLTKRKTKLQMMFADDLILIDDYKNRSNETEKEIQGINNIILEYSTKEKTEVKKFESLKVLEYLSSNILNIKSLDNANQKIFFYNFIEEITLDFADSKHFITNIKPRTTK